AAAVVEGTIGVTESDGTSDVIQDPVGQIPVLMIHGMQDTTVPYAGGEGTQGGLLKMNLGAKSVADAVSLWTATDSCTGTPTQLTSPDGNIIVDDYVTCENGNEVGLITIVNGKHQWATLQDQTQFSDTDAVWKFFSLHSKTE